ncbi:MAG: hypothetical protein WC588_00755 [Candidatus Micrarchaeia archaeon]
MEKTFALLACAFLLLGCALPGSEPREEGAVLPAPPPPQPPALGESPANQSENQTGGQSLPSQESLNKTAPSLNETAPGMPEEPLEEAPIDPFAGWVPRNVSEKIGEGRFFIPDQNSSPLRVYVIDAGNADAVLVNKGQFNLLLDAGDFGRVSAFLSSKGIKRLDVLAASRDSQDAIGGMAGVLDGIEIGEFWENGVPPESAEYATVIGKVEEKGIAVKKPQAGDTLEAWGMEILMLNPQKQRMLGAPESDALAMKVSFDGFCMLILNPTVQEREIAIMGGNADVRCDAMTYYRHGEGRPGPSLILEKAAPKDVIISVGANTEGLPSETTLTRLGLKEIKTWRTDIAGSIMVEKRKGRTYRVSAGQ